MALVEAIKASEKDAMKRLEKTQKKIEDMKVEIEEILRNFFRGEKIK